MMMMMMMMKTRRKRREGEEEGEKGEQESYFNMDLLTSKKISLNIREGLKFSVYNYYFSMSNVIPPKCLAQ